MHIKTSLYLTPILFKSHLCSSLLSNNSLICILQLSYMTSWVGSICPFKQALILLVSYSNLISVLLYTLGTLCTSKLALILLVSYSNLISVLPQINVLFSPFSAKVRKCPPLWVGPRFLNSADEQSNLLLS